MNGELWGTTRHAALCSGRVDGASFWVSDHSREQLRTDKQVISYAVFNGPDAAMEDGKSEVQVGDHEETAERAAEGTGLGADSGQSSNTNISPGKD